MKKAEEAEWVRGLPLPRVPVHDTSLHPARNGHDLSGEMAGELVGGEDDNLARDVLRPGDLAQGHRLRDTRHEVGIGEGRARHRGLGPAGTDCIDAPQRGNSDDLVLQAEQEAVGESRLGRRIVRMPGLPEESRGRADEDEVAMTGPLDLRRKARAVR